MNLLSAAAGVKNVAMPKSIKARARPQLRKVTFEWRGKRFGTREELLAHAQEQVRSILSPPVTRSSGDEVAFLQIAAVRPQLALKPFPVKERSRKAKLTHPVRRPNTSRAPSPLRLIGPDPLFGV